MYIWDTDRDTVVLHSNNGVKEKQKSFMKFHVGFMKNTWFMPSISSHIKAWGQLPMNYNEVCIWNI